MLNHGQEFEHQKNLGKRSMVFFCVMILILFKKSNTVFIGINFGR